ncbi:DUF3014 domain-containing protein [Corallococcus sp. M34]|uniref:DUF3014 domain-containing protein n=1 Tax=Citreicoccus inhibens TaxID=2849499 RepID=UPI001C21C699|nr:DUF3014 domain-containing protein [Citreicoccus inhibens]MBU8894752.1 DUF3014 domain-containing protein [Citreicoccus inhibens]
MNEPNFVKPPGDTPEATIQPARSPRAMVMGTVAALAVLAVVGSYFGLRRDAETPPVATPSVPAPVPAAPPAEVPVAAASLPDSDGRVRELVGKLSLEAELAKWLQEKDLIRRFTAAVSNIADGESPRTVLGFLAPTGAFEVNEARGAATTIHPRTYARYDAVARVLGTIDARGSGLVFRELHPLMDQAYAEIAPPGQTFDQALSRAIAAMLAVPAAESPVEVHPQGALYAYAAPELEGLSRAQKHLLRMGPANIRIIQAKLRELQVELKLPVAGR